MTTDRIPSIIVVDDDHEIRTLLEDFLLQHHYKIYTAKNGDELFALLHDKNTVDMIILDIMLPGEDGIEICKRVRKTSSVPIIMLTAIDTDTDRIVSLELGADDFLVKPFNPRELLARIKAVLRRSGNYVNHPSAPKSAYPSFEFSGWLLNTASRRLISPDQTEVALSAATYNLLLIFLEHPQRVLSRDQLLDMTKNRTATPFDRSIDIQVSRLRQKIEINPKTPLLIKTVRTGGYIFTSPTMRK